MLQSCKWIQSPFLFLCENYVYLSGMLNPDSSLLTNESTQAHYAGDLCVCENKDIYLFIY
jgi:hypothetical protein